MMKHWLVGLFAFAVATARAVAGVLLGVAPYAPDQPSNLYRIDPATGAATLIGSTGVAQMAGIAQSPGGTLYGYTPGALYTIDAGTGAATRVGFLGSTHPEGDLAFQPGSGVLFATKSSTADELVTLNLSTGASTTVGLLGAAGRDTSGLAFLPDGTLVGAAFGNGPDNLIRIDPATGAATVVGPLGTNAGLPSVGGLAYDPAAGIMYFTDSDALYTVNTATGAATFVGSFGVGQMAGLAEVVPEPGVGLGVLAAVGGVGVCRRRQGRAGRAG